jgi:hypothetical protein
MAKAPELPTIPQPIIPIFITIPLKKTVPGSGFRVPGSGFRVPGSGFRVQGSGFQVQGSRFQVPGSGFQVQGSRFRVPGSGFRVQRLQPMDTAYHNEDRIPLI